MGTAPAVGPAPPTLARLHAETLVARHAALDGPDLEWLHLLVGDWQVLSDLAFADLGCGCRPRTATSSRWPSADPRRVPPCTTTTSSGRPRRTDNDHSCSDPSTSAPPSAPANPAGPGRTPCARRPCPSSATAERSPCSAPDEPRRRPHAQPARANYVEAADDIFAMVGRGEFPAPDAPTGPRQWRTPRRRRARPPQPRGRGPLPSPNALSCFHRLGVVGDLVGRSLGGHRRPHLAGGHGRRVDAARPHGTGAWRVDVESAGWPSRCGPCR